MHITDISEHACFPLSRCNSLLGRKVTKRVGQLLRRFGATVVGVGKLHIGVHYRWIAQFMQTLDKVLQQLALIAIRVKANRDRSFRFFAGERPIDRPAGVVRTRHAWYQRDSVARRDQILHRRQLLNACRRNRLKTLLVAEA